MFPLAVEKEGIKINVEKCHLCLKEISMLGHIVLAVSRRLDTKTLQARKECPVPGNLKSLRRLIAFCPYIGKWVPKHSIGIQLLLEAQKQRSFPLSSTVNSHISDIKSQIADDCLNLRHTNAVHQRLAHHITDCLFKCDTVYPRNLRRSKFYPLVEALIITDVISENVFQVQYRSGWESAVSAQHLASSAECFSDKALLNSKNETIWVQMLVNVDVSTGEAPEALETAYNPMAQNRV